MDTATLRSESDGFSHANLASLDRPLKPDCVQYRTTGMHLMPTHAKRRRTAHATCLGVLAIALQFATYGCSAGGAINGGAEPDSPGGGGAGATAYWSDPQTWGGGEVPTQGNSVHIGPEETVVLDVTTAGLDELRIEGTLIADPLVDVGIVANSILIMSGGTLQIGSEEEPYSRAASLTLTGPRGEHVQRAEDGGLDNDGIQRGIQVMDGGTLRLFGETPELLKTKLAAHAPALANTFTVADPLGWRAGDRIAISLTDFYGVGETEILTLASNATGTSLRTTTGLQTSRWGLLQYPLDAPIGGTAVSLTPGQFTPPSPTSATVLDERAEIVNLSRRIVIQGADDADWANEGFGVHVMVMGLSSKAQVRGVEFRRCGQRRAMGRYPFHWHMLSYAGATYRGDAVAADHQLRDCAIWESENRAVTIHGTCGVTVENTYAVDIKGHAFFMEDGPERRNTIKDCVAMLVRNPTSPIKVHDNQASGFWLTNPDNIIVDNSASDCTGRGLWNSFATACFGASRNVAMSPKDLDILEYDGNTGHSNLLQGITTEFAVTNEAGNTSAQRFDGDGPFTLSRNIVWKNSGGGYLNRVKAARYVDWVAADNNGRDFSGQTLGAEMTGTLLIGSSLNNATPFSDPRRIGLSSYHYQLDIKDVTLINYPYVGPTITNQGQFVYGGGAFDSSDQYVHSIAVGGARNSGWKLINSHAGYVTPAPYFDGFPLYVASQNKYRYWSLPVTHDMYGYWGSPGDYMVPNVPFFTHDLSSSTVSSYQSDLVFTPDRFFGIGTLQIDLPGAPPWGGPSPLVVMRCARLNSNNIEVDDHTIGAPNLSVFFPNMRSFSLKNGGRYRITLPGEALPTTDLSIYLKNAYRPDDSVLVGLPWPGATPVSGRLDAGYETHYTEAERLTSGTARLLHNTGTSISDVLADGTGATMWQDSANNTVWVQVIGGLNYPNGQLYSGSTDNGLEKPMAVRLRAQ